jgi:hypothetical protein
MMVNDALNSYFGTVESQRLSPSCPWKARHAILLAEERLLICTCLIGSQLTSALSMWECGDSPHEDICEIINSIYGTHIDGFLNIANGINLGLVQNRDILLSYQALAAYNSIFRMENETLGRGLVLLTFLAIFLSEYWATCPDERRSEIAFPDEPMFVKRSFFQRCVRHCNTISDFVESKRFFSKLDSSIICSDIFSLLGII